MAENRLNLKPCPFCGGAPFFDCTTSSHGAEREINSFSRTYKLTCSKCECTVGARIMVSFDYSPHTGLRADESELNRAIERWNRRADHGNAQL